VRFRPRRISDGTNRRKRSRHEAPELDAEDFPHTPRERKLISDNLAILEAKMNQNSLGTGKISVEARAYLEEELKQGRRKINADFIK
jgi:hypothetical protein